MADLQSRNRESVGPPELLAPAGDFAALEAAIAAGADAVYFGLSTLNARRRAKNFSPDDFRRAVSLLHERGRRVYLTLNIDLTERELGQAARMLALAGQCGVDAVLVRDPALLALRPNYPAIAFHFSTQSCMANSADVAAAGQLGATRVVLARELSLDEIAACSAVEGVETEVFGQGALCFSLSGRCLLSSWVGGRSGNRGACTSPCRVPWAVDQRPAGTPLSMRDLATAHRLPELAAAGVRAIKIEGRLKNAEWVSRAVSLYRHAIDGAVGTSCRDVPCVKQGDAEPEATGPVSEKLDYRDATLGELQEMLLREAETLGDYTGREMTSDYLDAKRDELTGTATGRQVSPKLALPDSSTDVEQEATGPVSEKLDNSEPALPTFDFSINVTPAGIECRFALAERATEWKLPKTVVRRAHKAYPIAQALRLLSEVPQHGYRLGRGETNDPEFLLVPRAFNGLVERVSALVRQAHKGADRPIHADLPAEVRDLLEKSEPHAANKLALGERPDRARIDASAVARAGREMKVDALVVEGVTADSLPRVAAAAGVPVVVALPAVFFEDELKDIERLLRACAKERITVEVNSWGGWRLARAHRVRMEAGPGLAVLNSLAARSLSERGMKCVTLSPEADRRQLEDISAHCPAPCSLVVFGRPPLLTTRVAVSDAQRGGLFEDRRGVQLKPRRERGLWVFRPVEPFDLRNCNNERIKVAHLVVDLVGADDPIGDWYDVPLSDWKRFRFNYDRTLA